MIIEIAGFNRLAENKKLFYMKHKKKNKLFLPFYYYFFTFLDRGR